MSAAAAPSSLLDFTLPPALEAHEPPEARGLARDGVRLLVARRATAKISHHRFTELPSLLSPGDVLVVNRSATVPAALDTPRGLVVHVSTQLDDGTWVIELRRGGEPLRDAAAGQSYQLPGRATVRLLRPYTEGRLWVATCDVAMLSLLARYGRPIRYRYVDREWPLSAYQTVFAIEPGSAEMPSAGRPFSDRVVTRLVARGVVITPITLHTGVASPEAHEKPYPERFDVPAVTARIVSEARAAGARIIAVGTTVVRALETAADRTGMLHPSRGWTSQVVTPDTGVRVVDGVLTGFHEPRASHLAMLAAIAGHDLLRTCYQEALDAGYLWHEFGDGNLLLP